MHLRSLPGLLVALLFAAIALRYMFRIMRHPDLPQTSQLSRAILFALVMANVANFIASAQTYSDPVLTLLTAFFVGCLFATATLDDRNAAAVTAAGAL